MSRLSLRGVGKTWPRAARAALDGVDIDAAPGEVLGIIGESGSGKTTLLRVIAGLEEPTTGTAMLDGNVVSAPGSVMPPERRNAGLVFQDYALFPHLTVAGNIGYGLHRLERKQRNARVIELLDLIGMAGYADRFPHELSGGQQQRTALARALAPRPAIILLDEPFSNLDAALRQELRTDIARILRSTNTTSLIVVHDADDVMALADRVAILRDGRVLQTGTPRALYERPLDAYIARFFGPTNIVHAVAHDGVFDTPLGVVASTLAAGCDGPVLLSVRPADITLVDGGVCAVVRRADYRGAFIEFAAALVTTGDDVIEVIGHAPVSSGLVAGQRVGIRVRENGVQMLGRSA